MKRLLPLLSILFIAIITITACTSSPKQDAAAAGKVLTYTDTTGLAEFQKWKVANELASPEVYYQQGQEVASAAPVKKTTSQKPAARKTYTEPVSMNSSSSYPAKTTAKKGWSRKAKGAVIGGGSGAILGAVINKKNRVVGGAIGAAIGTGLGYVLGNELDKKHGR